MSGIAAIQVRGPSATRGDLSPSIWELEKETGTQRDQISASDEIRRESEVAGLDLSRTDKIVVFFELEMSKVALKHRD